ncbi:MAG: FHA domain-containing protein [Spirochaetales bacterium]|nr:FHA domain-containing protein [Spirochaetales bacterium]
MAPKSFTQILEPNVRLLVTKGEDQGRIHETNRFPFVVGRDEAADFQIKYDNNVSRKHARFTRDDSGAVWIEDLGSTNGSFVNNVRISARTALNHGSTIIVGNTWIKFIVSSPAAPARPAALNDEEATSSTFTLETKKVESILVLDLADSSGLVDRYGDDVAMKITETLNAVAFPVFTRYGADYSKGTGDGFLVTFSNPAHALAAAADILKKVKSYNAAKTRKVKMHVRLCLNHGQSIIEPNGDRHGNATNVAFRVEGVRYQDMKKTKDSPASSRFPEYDRILVTEPFYEELDAARKKKFKLLGSFKLKGIGGWHRVYAYKG